MRKIRHYLSAAAVALIATGCSSDEFNGNEGGSSVSPEDGVYLAVDIRMPSANGTRSETDNPEDGNSASNTGVEIGQESENKVQSVYIVLAKKDNTFIAGAEANGEDVAEDAKSGDYKTTATLTKSELEAYYKSANATTEVNVFVFCNPTAALKSVLDEAELGDNKWYNAVGTYNVATEAENKIWASGKFLMANSKIADRSLPANIEDWNSYNVKTNPFDLSGMNNAGLSTQVDNYQSGKRGSVDVERVAARFDFRDGSEDGVGNNDPNYNGVGKNTYEVLFRKNNDDTESKTALVNITLTKMALVNMNNAYHYLRHVSPYGLNTDMKICEPEMPWTNGRTGNYVVDAYWEWKNSTPSKGFSTHFNYPLFNEDGTIDNTSADEGKDKWGTAIIEEVLKGNNDNNQSWNTSGEYKQGRRILNKLNGY